jgi:hypothetical protein
MAVIVLGGTHALSAPVRQLGNGECELIRPTTTPYAEVTGEKAP